MVGKDRNNDDSKKDMGKKGGETRKGPERSRNSTPEDENENEVMHDKHVKAEKQSHKKRS